LSTFEIFLKFATRWQWRKCDGVVFSRRRATRDSSELSRSIVRFQRNGEFALQGSSQVQASDRRQFGPSSVTLAALERVRGIDNVISIFVIV
jgi:hypothetical protein